MVLNAEFSLVSVSKLSVPVACVLGGSWLIVMGHSLSGAIIFAAGIASYFAFGYLFTKSAVKIARSESRKENIRLKRIQESREHSKEKAEQRAREMQDRRQHSIEKAEQHTRKIKEKGLFSVGKKILDNLDG